MNQDFSIVTLVLHASVVVQLVMAGLMLASLSSWTVIFGKLFGLRKSEAANDEFEREFWAGRNLNDLYTEATERPSNAPMERIFASGMREFFKLREKRVMDPGALARRRAPGDAGELPARARHDRVESLVSRLGGLGVALRRPVRHGVGNHACLHRPGEHDPGDARNGRPRHRRSPRRDRHRPVRGDPGGDRLQPVRARHRPHRRASWRASSRSSRTSCSETPARCRRRRRSLAPDRPKAANTMPAVAQRSSRRRTINEINMVPFIDVMLVLLIIFMVTAPLITTGVVDLPSVGRSTKRRRSTSSSSSSVPTSSCACASTARTPARSRSPMSDGVRSKRRAATPTRRSSSPPTRASSTTSSCSAMDALQRAGVQRVGLSVKSQRG